MQGQEERREETTVQHFPAQSGDVVINVGEEETSVSTRTEVSSLCYFCQTPGPCPISNNTK